MICYNCLERINVIRISGGLLPAVLNPPRKGPIASEEPANLADLTDRFVDFLMEEPWVDSEGIIMFSESINPLCMSSCSFVLLFFKRLFDQRVL